VAGNLTIDRTQSSGYTAIELNSLFDTFVAQFASTLPSVVRTRCGNEFDNISISDGDAIATGIDSPDSLYRAIAYLGQELYENGDCVDESANSNWGTTVVAGTTFNSWSMTVRDRDDDDDDDDGFTLSPSTNYINPYVFQNGQSSTTLPNRSIELQSIALLDRVNTTSLAFQLMLNNAGSRVPISNTSTNVGNIPAFLNGQTIATRRFSGTIGSQVPTIYSSIDITPTSYSGGTTITLSNGIQQVVDGGLSDNTSLPLITVEHFDGIGLDQWSPSVSSALTTLTIETFTEDVGLLSWNIPTPTTLTTEPFSVGWPLGTQPSSASCAGSENEITENLTSQITGTIQTFELTRPYVSGSLRVYWNGQRQTVGDTITEINDTQFSTTFLPTVGTELIADLVPK
tara:strand:- start:21187 stop:22386 length:1200 start_codon:yes stop_codon:yes gene_type:complete